MYSQDSPTQDRASSWSESLQPNLPLIYPLPAPALEINQLQMMSPGNAWLFLRGDPPWPVEARPAALVPQLARLAAATPADGACR